MAKVLQGSSIVVFPSYYGEGLPKILIEAVHGVPVITTDHLAVGCDNSKCNWPVANQRSCGTFKGNK